MPGPSSGDVKAVAITRAHGGVTNPEALLTGEGSATLTMEVGGPAAVIVLDYGQEVGGTPYLNISTCEALPFLNTNQTTSLAREAAAGATNVKVTNAAPFAAGTDITVDTSDVAETRTITEVGSAAAPDTSLVLPAAAGDTNVSVASVNGYFAGGPIAIGGEEATITSVNTGAGAPTTIVYPVSTGGANVKVASVTGFGVGEQVLIDTGAGMEFRTAASVGTPATTRSLFSAANAGDANIKVISVSGLAVGNEIDIEPGASQDHVTITNVGTAGVNTTVSVTNTTTGLPVPGYSDAYWIWNTKLDAAAATKNAHIRDIILGAFINQVDAQTGKAFTREEADLLILLTQALISDWDFEFLPPVDEGALNRARHSKTAQAGWAAITRISCLGNIRQLFTLIVGACLKD